MELINHEESDYKRLIQTISGAYMEGRTRSVKLVRREMLLTYWEIGRHIVEFEQTGGSKSNYGDKLLNKLSKDLSHQLEGGFSRSNLVYMRLCYLKYSNSALLSHQLTWGHYLELLKIEHDLERAFYEKQSILERWTIRELKRQKKTSLFLRLAASQDKEGILKLAAQGRVIENPIDVVRDPYVLEFLKVPEP